MKRTKTITILIYAILIFFCLMVLVPLTFMLTTSLKSMEEITVGTGADFLPKAPTIQAYINIWRDYPMLTYFKNSIIIVSLATIISLVFSTFAGYGVTRFQFKGKGAFLSFLLVTQMFPSIMMLIPFYKVLQTYHLVNKIVGLVVVYISFTIPMLTWMMMGFFQSIPKELDEAAMIDGCSRFRTFTQIILPLTAPGLVSSAIYAFIVGWNEYLFAMILTTDETLKTLPVGIGQMVGFYKIMWNDLMAASIVSSIPLLIIFLFLQRYLVSSLTAGAVKQ